MLLAQGGVPKVEQSPFGRAALTFDTPYSYCQFCINCCITSFCCKPLKSTPNSIYYRKMKKKQPKIFRVCKKLLTFAPAIKQTRLLKHNASIAQLVRAPDC